LRRNCFEKKKKKLKKKIKKKKNYKKKSTTNFKSQKVSLNSAQSSTLEKMNIRRSLRWSFRSKRIDLELYNEMD